MRLQAPGAMNGCHRQMFFDSAARYVHAFGDFGVRKPFEPTQNETFLAARRKLLYSLHQNCQPLASDEMPFGAWPVIYRIDIVGNDEVTSGAGPAAMMIDHKIGKYAVKEGTGVERHVAPCGGQPQAGFLNQFLGGGLIADFQAGIAFKFRIAPVDDLCQRAPWIVGLLRQCGLCHA